MDVPQPRPVRGTGRARSVPQIGSLRRAQVPEAAAPGPAHHPSVRRIESPWGSPQTRQTPEDRLLCEATCELLSVGEYAFGPNWAMPPRTLPNYVLYAPVSGRADFVVDARRATLADATIILAAPNTLHSGMNDPLDPATFRTLHFVVTLPGGVELSRVLRMPAVIIVSEATKRQLNSTLECIVEELSVPQAGSRLIVTAQCLHLLGLLWREAVSTPESLVTLMLSGDMLRIAPAMEMIERRYADQLTLTELAASAHLSAPYFTTVFRRATGISPMRYVLCYRLEQAKRYLRASDQSLAEIADETGFSDPSYLSRAFKRRFGISATTWRTPKSGPSNP